MKKTAAVVAGVLVAVLTACGSADKAEPIAATPSTSAGAAAASGFTATSIRLEGPWYTIDLPQVDGGKTDARNEFNSGMRAEADAFIRDAAENKKVTGFNSQILHIGGHVLSGVLGIEVDDGGLHPHTFKRTHVTNIDTGNVITLPVLFIDLRQGLDVLSAQAAVQVPHTRVGTNAYDKAFVEPKAENFERWAATPDGMRIYLGEIASHALGFIDITVPWSELDGVLRPGLRAVLSS